MVYKIRADRDRTRTWENLCITLELGLFIRILQIIRGFDDIYVYIIIVLLYDTSRACGRKFVGIYQNVSIVYFIFNNFSNCTDRYDEGI